MAFGDTTDPLDNFNRTDNDDLGSNWTEGDLGDGDAFKIASNILRGTGANVVSDARWNVETFGPDCECFATLVDLPRGLGDRASVICRIVQPGDTTWDGYKVDLRPGSEDADYQMVIVEVTNDSFTEITSKTNVTISDGHRIGIEFIGDASRAMHYDGTSWNEIVADAEDTSHQAAGNIGLKSENFSVGNPPHWDDFGGGTISVGGPAGGKKGIVALLRQRRWPGVPCFV